MGVGVLTCSTVVCRCERLRVVTGVFLLFITAAVAAAKGLRNKAGADCDFRNDPDSCIAKHCDGNQYTWTDCDPKNDLTSCLQKHCNFS